MLISLILNLLPATPSIPLIPAFHTTPMPTRQTPLTARSQHLPKHLRSTCRSICAAPAEASVQHLPKHLRSTCQSICAAPAEAPAKAPAEAPVQHLPKHLHSSGEVSQEYALMLQLVMQRDFLSLHIPSPPLSPLPPLPELR